MFLKHYGTPRHSGRYKWGSGDDPEQRGKSFLGQVADLKKQGMAEVDIAKGFGMSVQQLRNRKSSVKAEQRKADVGQALRLKDKGYSNVEIGKRMGINESSVRALLNPSIQERSEMTNNTAKVLKDAVDAKSYIDVGIGVERHLGISRTRLKVAISQLEDDGYRIHKFDVEQLGTGKKTNMIVLTKDTVDYGEILKNKHNVRMITDYSEDGGRSFLGLEPPRSIDSNRIKIRYHEDGGSDKDGVIELRRGVDDISLGNSKYAQVRIGVDDKYYMKGMALYDDNMPKGVDIVYNVNKKKNTDKLGVMKVMSADMNDPKAKAIQALKVSKEEKDNLLKKGVMDGSIKTDPDNPFGASVRQKHYTDSKGKDQLSALNIVNEEGEWRDKWSKSLSSQMLSKQTTELARTQLKLTYDIKKEQFDERLALTNPVVKKKMLESFADDADSSSVHLKAAALPRSGWHVLMPIPSIKPTEIYAPNYRDGDKVVLIRYPHGGIFEIPELTVNNKNDGKKVLAGAKDAVGIHPKVAEKLSGADFDGDTVLVIPNKGNIKTAPSLKGLVDFDPKTAYPKYEGMPIMSSRTKGIQMGLISNLITDMTIKGASPDGDEICRAVKHSMVVIDAEKHKLNYKQSYIDNGIAALNLKYQQKPNGGASTLISRASSEVRVDKREEGIKIVNDVTGKTRRIYVDSDGNKLYNYTNETYTTPERISKSGKVIAPKTIKKRITSTKMAEATDAFELSSGTPIEAIYATHANKLKALANDARKTAMNIKLEPALPSARETYKAEVASLTSKLNIALKNKPLERQAHLLGNHVVATKKANNPDMDEADLKKIKGQALAEARLRVGTKKHDVVIEPKEWDAIQSRAISPSLLSQIINNTDMDKLTKLATPRTSLTLTTAKQTKAKAMLAKGYTQSEIADALGVSTSTVAKVLN